MTVNELRGAPSNDTVQRVDELGVLALAAVELLGDREVSVRGVLWVASWKVSAISPWPTAMELADSAAGPHSTPAAVWYRSSAFFARSFRTRAESRRGIDLDPLGRRRRLAARGGSRPISSGSAAVKGRLPESIS